jgi:hypothetical protein
MNSQTQRRVVHDPAVEREVVPFKRNWRKPLEAVLADATVNSRVLLARLQRGVYCTDWDKKPYYQSVLNQLCEHTRQQINLIEAFSAIEWSE